MIIDNGNIKKKNDIILNRHLAGPCPVYNYTFDFSRKNSNIWDIILFSGGGTRVILICLRGWRSSRRRSTAQTALLLSQISLLRTSVARNIIFRGKTCGLRVRYWRSDERSSSAPYLAVGRDDYRITVEVGIVGGDRLSCPIRRSPNHRYRYRTRFFLFFLFFFIYVNWVNTRTF